jgi:hypothetical protein
MKIQGIFILTLCILNVCNGQICKPTSNIKASIYGLKCKDSIKASCFRTALGLRPTDSSFSIISYIVYADGAGFDQQVEVLNTGANFNQAKTLIQRIRPGNFAEFKCIKANYTNGTIYILQPLLFKLE